MYKNPYELFGVNPDMKPEELKDILTGYKDELMHLKLIYAGAFDQVKMSAMRVKNRSQMVEELLAKRYEFGLNFHNTVLREDEINDFLKNVRELTPMPGDKQDGITTVFAKDVGKRSEMFTMSSMLVSEFNRKIEEALEAYRKDPNNSAPMMDVLLEIKLNDQKAKIAEYTARLISSHGVLCSEDEFKEALINSDNYKKLMEIYRQVATKEKRDELVPETYLMKNLADSGSHLATISKKEVLDLLEKEFQYSYAHTQGIADRVVDPELRKLPPEKNQDHDYGWGIVLLDPEMLISQESVHTPMFSGKISVEALGSMMEKSLYRKNQYFTEREVPERRTVRPTTRRTLFPRREKVEPDAEPKMRVIRDYYYLHEASKTLTDQIYRITKTDEEGRTSTHIIFSPLSYADFRDPKKRDFIKRIYCSDIMLDIAAQNGGYAGRIEENSFGYYISNLYAHEEIASAIMFQNDRQGSILDCRHGTKIKMSEATKDTFEGLIGNKGRGELARDE